MEDYETALTEDLEEDNKGGARGGGDGDATVASGAGTDGDVGTGGDGGGVSHSALENDAGDGGDHASRRKKRRLREDRRFGETH